MKTINSKIIFPAMLILGISLTAQQAIAANSQSQVIETTVKGPLEYKKEVNIITTIKGQSGLQQNIDIEIYNQEGKRVAQKVFQSNLLLNEQKNYSFNWIVTETGTFTVKVGIFSNDWSTVNEWNDNAASFQVNNPFDNPTYVPPTPPFSIKLNSAYASSVEHEYPSKGDTMYIGAVVENIGASGNALIDIELYKDGKLINQKVFSDADFSPFLVQPFVMTWIADNPGKYTVNVGLFKQNWEGLISWHEKAASFTVTESPQTSTFYNLYLQNSLDPKWQNWSWDTDVVMDYNQIDAKFKSPWAAVYLHTDSLFDTTPYNILNVSVYQEGFYFDGMQLLVYGENGQVLSKTYLHDSSVNSIPLSEINADHRKITGVAIQGSSGKISKETYITNISFENRPGVE